MDKHKEKKDVLNKYDQSFYSEQMDGSIQSARFIVPFIITLFPDIKSVVDLGCGVGTWLAEFKRNGVGEVLGYDGGNPPAAYLQINEDEYQKTDFSSEMPVQIKVDLAMSLEVAEHLDEKYAQQFIRNLCGHSDLILFSAAIPGQGGTHHVNERWPSYWANLFNQEGFKIYDVIRPNFWYDKRIEFWYRQNMFLVINNDRKDLIAQIEPHIADVSHQMDIVHPEMYMQTRNQLDAIAKRRSIKLAHLIYYLPHKLIGILGRIAHKILPRSMAQKLSNAKRALSGH
jgi:SAM-dependent methyltransferase